MANTEQPGSPPNGPAPSHEEDISQKVGGVVAGWKAAHRKASADLKSKLVEPGASGAEAALADAAAHDLQILDEIAAARIALASLLRTSAETFNPKHFKLLSQSLLDLERLRTEGTRRVNELLQASATLATRREQRQQQAQQVQPPSLRRVI